MVSLVDPVMVMVTSLSVRAVAVCRGRGHGLRTQNAIRPAAPRGEQPARCLTSRSLASGGCAVGVDVVVALDVAGQEPGPDRPEDGAEECNEDARLRVK